MNHPDLMGLDVPKVWDTELAFKHLYALRKANTKRSVERLLHEMKILPEGLKPGSLSDEFARQTNQLLLNWALGKARTQGKLVLFVQLFDLPSEQPCLHANDALGDLPLDL